MPKRPEVIAYLPALWLYELAFKPRRVLNLCHRESLENDGWLEEFPAVLILKTGSHPRVQGQHRLAWLAEIGRLDLLVPCIITYEGAP